MGRPRILVAEDEVAIRSLVATVLQEDGYVVQEASDGLSTLQAIEAERPDLLILDMAMPVMSGDAMLQTLQSQGNVVPVIIMTANPLRYRWLRQRVVAVLTKPFDLTELLDLVAAVLAHKR